jgi:hypothetical protein
VTTVVALAGSLACFEVANRIPFLRWTVIGSPARVTSVLDVRARRGGVQRSDRLAVVAHDDRLHGRQVESTTQAA